MNRWFKIALFSVIVSLLFCPNAFSDDKDSIMVVVEFNGNNHNISKKVAFSESITALEALMYVAKVQTHPVGNYVFVDEINDVCNIKGCNAWYYSINRKMAKKLAINCELAPGDVVKWIYKQDVCSKTSEKNNKFEFSPN